MLGTCKAMVADDARAVDHLPLLSEAERRQVLVEWNATGAAFPRDKCVHELFEAQAARTPDAIAVMHEDVHLTYAELNVKANRLAHHLRTLGVQPDALVAICVERSLDTEGRNEQASRRGQSPHLDAARLWFEPP
jgi:non-ribosomal peptide synthetase component F